MLSRYKMGAPYLDAYNEYFPKSKPQDEWESRVRLYSMYSSTPFFKIPLTTTVDTTCFRRRTTQQDVN